MEGMNFIVGGFFGGTPYSVVWFEKEFYKLVYFV
jgi:hypothetical protein